MKVNVNSPGYVLTFAAVVSTLFTGAIMTLQALSESTARAAAELYEQKALVTVFGLADDANGPLSDDQVRSLYREHIHPLAKPLIDPQTGKVFNDANAPADAVARRTYVATRVGGEVIGYAVPVGGIGFWSQIDGYLAVTPGFDKAIGIVFVRHQETPGLGGRITEPKWRKQFAGLDITKAKAGKDARYVYVGGDRPMDRDDPKFGHHVDAITGATGTSTAVQRFLNEDIGAMRRAAAAAGLIEKKGQEGPRASQPGVELSRRVGRPIADCGLRIADFRDREPGETIRAFSHEGPLRGNHSAENPWRLDGTPDCGRLSPEGAAGFSRGRKPPEMAFCTNEPRRGDREAGSYRLAEPLCRPFRAEFVYPRSPGADASGQMLSALSGLRHTVRHG